MHGQIAETVGPRDGEDPVAHYLQVIADKTGSLIATSARFGGMFGGAPAEHIEALAGYGETIGVAFQLSDDLLDIASESAQSGKTPGTDLREGVPTLPVLYALAVDDADAAVGAAAGDPGRRPGHRRRAARRGARAAARVAGAEAGPGDRPQLRRGRPRAARPAARTARPAAPSSRSATSSPTAPADRPVPPTRRAASAHASRRGRPGRASAVGGGGCR